MRHNCRERVFQADWRENFEEGVPGARPGAGGRTFAEEGLARANGRPAAPPMHLENTWMQGYNNLDFWEILDRTFLVLEFF